MKDTFLQWAIRKGWKVEMRQEPVDLPPTVLERYKNISEEWVAFVRNIKFCISISGTVWFLNMEDYLPKNSQEWRYNEFELISLEAAQDDQEWVRTIRSFWNRHLPIVMSVGEEYEYYAIDTDNGTIVRGNEPEFEETVVVADSFGEFVQKIADEEIQFES